MGVSRFWGARAQAAPKVYTYGLCAILLSLPSLRCGFECFVIKWLVDWLSFHLVR